MAIGVRTNLVQYDDEFYGSFVETLAQASDFFNANSFGSMNLRTEFSRGDYKKEAFFESIASIVSRRDLTSVSANVGDALTTDDFIWPKRAVKWNVTNTHDSFERQGVSMGEFAAAVGRQAAKALQVEYLDALLLAMRTCIVKTAASLNDASDGTIQVADLLTGIEKMGDRHADIAALVMHSHVFFDLVGDQITNLKIDRAAGFSVATGLPQTFGRPVLVTDSASLIVEDGVTSGTDSYYTLGLMPGAGTVQITNVRNGVFEVDGLEQLAYRIQGEVDYLVGVKGYAYTGSNLNPTDAQLDDAADWTLEVDSVKDAAGFAIETR